MFSPLETTEHYHLPAEWEHQSGVMLTWPNNKSYWAPMLDDIEQVFVNVVREIALRQLVIISAYGYGHKHHIQNLLKIAGVNLRSVAIYLAPANDIWVRDHGPISVLQNGEPLLLNFKFNGWGNKYPGQSSLDNEITPLLHAQNAFAQTPIESIDIVLEGGAIEVDGQGTLLATSSCLFTQSRNPHLSRGEIEQTLQEKLGIKKMLWLDSGYLAGDDTDGHIDTLARFVNPQTICYIKCNDPQDEHYKALLAMEKQLKSFTDYTGKPYQLVPLPWPKARFSAEGRRLPATYANFLIINTAILLPTYDDPADQEAITIMQKIFPEYEIIGINALPIIEGFGSLHCMTMQLPIGILA